MARFTRKTWHSQDVWKEWRLQTLSSHVDFFSQVVRFQTMTISLQATGEWRQNTSPDAPETHIFLFFEYSWQLRAHDFTNACEVGSSPSWLCQSPHFWKVIWWSCFIVTSLAWSSSYFPVCICEGIRPHFHGSTEWFIVLSAGWAESHYRFMSPKTYLIEICSEYTPITRTNRRSTDIDDVRTVAVFDVRETVDFTTVHSGSRSKCEHFAKMLGDQEIHGCITAAPLCELLDLGGPCGART